MSMTQFANTVSMVLGDPVLDRTEIPGSFDIHLEFNPEGTNLTGHGASNAGCRARRRSFQAVVLYRSSNN